MKRRRDRLICGRRSRFAGRQGCRRGTLDVRAPNEHRDAFPRERLMRTRNLLLASVAGLAMVLSSHTLKAQAPAALTGQVTSQEEGAMEGVLVSAKKAGSTVTATGVSDAQGKFRYPASKLGAGQYHI